jgi:hypothetical protein
VSNVIKRSPNPSFKGFLGWWHICQKWGGLIYREWRDIFFVAAAAAAAGEVTNIYGLHFVKF